MFWYLVLGQAGFITGIVLANPIKAFVRKLLGKTSAEINRTKDRIS